jgi:hypothetical protein
MALKILKELKLRDKLYYLDNGNEVRFSQVFGITTTEIQFGNEGVFKYKTEDETCFSFVLNERFGGTKTYYLNKITALKERTKILNKELESLFEFQKNVLEKIQSKTSSILENNLLIVEENK